MDPVLVNVLFGVLSLVGGYFLRHLTPPSSPSPVAPSVPATPSQPSGHPILDQLSAAALAALGELLKAKQVQEGHSELKDVLSGVAQAPPKA